MPPCLVERTVMLVRGRRGRQRVLRRCSSLVGARAKGKGRGKHAKVFGPGHSANFYSGVHEY